MANKTKVTESHLASLLSANEIPVIYIEADVNMKVVKREVWAFLDGKQVQEFLSATEDDAKDDVKDFQIYSAYAEVTGIKPMAVGRITAYGTDRAWERNLKSAVTADPEKFLIDLTASKATPTKAVASKANVKKRAKSPAARKAAGAPTPDDTLAEKLEESVQQVRRRKPTAAAAKAAPAKATAKAAPAKRTAAKPAAPAAKTPVPRAAAVRKAAVARKAAPVAKKTTEAPKPQARRIPRKRA